jgi:Fe-S-cluster containining protein
MGVRKCQRCGACCRELLLEVSGVDVLREPRWLPYLERYRDIDYRNWESEPDGVIFRIPSPCPFLQDNRCTIYPTRSDMCVVFRPVKDNRCAQNPHCIFDYAECRRWRKKLVIQGDFHE